MAASEAWALLVVDGDPARRATIRRAIEEAELLCRIEEESDPARVPERLAVRRYECLIAGDGMIRTSASALVQQLREGGFRAPILGVIDRPDEALEVSLIEAGVTDLIPRHDVTPAGLSRHLRYASLVAWHGAKVTDALEQATRAIEARDEILAIVSHDLRNPLGAIGIAADELEDPALTPEVRSSLVGAIRRSVRRADRLINDLLDASRLDAGGLVPDLRPVGVQDLLEDVRRDQELLAHDVQMEIIVKVAQGLPPVRVDRERIRQALGNLVANALHHARSSGSVELLAMPGPALIRISVVDHGPGISSDALPHVFDRYWQAKRQRRAGAGLGLAIAKAIIEAHGGTIHVHSVEERGTTFTVDLPAAA